MILIFSNETDNSTTKVIEWLSFLKKDWIRINIEDSLELEFTGLDIWFIKNNFKFSLKDITSVWYRKGYLSIKNLFYTNISQLQQLQNSEIETIINFIYYSFESRKQLNSIKNIDANKLIVNQIAKNLGINVPQDYLFSNLNSLRALQNDTINKFVTKVISGNCMQNFEDFTIYNYTKELDGKLINSETFFPSLVQNKIDKKYELRIFYLDGIFYSMAIFSQRDNQTNVDFRNYNNNKPNRTIPFTLPNEIAKKLDRLMKKLDVNCGSIDMIVTPNNDYVFLEVNPVGQFGMVSYPCNYNLEKIIAEYL